MDLFYFLLLVQADAAKDAHVVVGTDWNGIAVVIAAIFVGITSVLTTVLQWKARQTHDVDKKEAIAARTEQNVVLAEQTAKLDLTHTLVNDRSTKQDEMIERLGTEIQRVAVPGASPTPTAEQGGPVTLGNGGSVESEDPNPKKAGQP